MQYPYLALLGIITILLTLSIGVVFFYFLLKRWQETKFLTVLKALALYELGSILIYLVYPFPFSSGILKFGLSGILNILIFGVIVFFAFYFISKKILSINWKKSLACFLLVVVIGLPFLDYFRILFVKKISNFSIFAKENAKMEAEMRAYFEQYGFGVFISPIVPPPPEPLKAIEIIERATLSWPIDLLIEVTSNL